MHRRLFSLFPGTLLLSLTHLAAAQTATLPAPLSPKEKAFIATVEKAMNDDRSSAALLPFLDGNIFADRATRRILNNAEFKNGARKGAAKSYEKGDFLAAAIKSLGDSGRFLYLHPATESGERMLTFRMQGDGGFNYLSFALRTNPAGDLKIVDIYSLLTGEFISDTVGRELARASVLTPEGKLKEGDALTVGIAEMGTALRDDNPKKALDVYATLDIRLRRSRLVQLLRLQAAQKTSQTEYIAAIEDLRKLLPDDTTAALLSVDGFFLAKKYPEALAAIDRVDAGIHDKFLDLLRGQVYLISGKPGQAITCAKSALLVDKKSFAAVDLLLTAALAAKDHATTADALVRLETDCGSSISDLTQVDTFKDFVASPQYTLWKKSHPAK